MHHSLEDLRGLRDKYARMLTLRDAPAAPSDPRLELARLAGAFPGALREIDRLPRELITERIASLGTAIDDPVLVERWMVAQVVFHRVARSALRAKRWLVGRKAISESMRADFARAHPDEAFFELEAIARPPRGRLMDLVHGKVARILDVPENEARHLVFGMLVEGRKPPAAAISP